MIRRALAGAAVLALIALAWLLWPRSRSAAPPPEMRAGEPAGEGGRPAVRLDRPLPPTVSAGRRPKSELPPPPDDAPATHAATGAARVALKPGELPLIPPAFEKPEERAAFRRWWMQETERRIGIYEKLEPGHPFPDGETTAHLLSEYYDAAEARRPGESADEASARADRLFARLNDFIAAFGVPPQTVSTRAGDPQYGVPLPPPAHVITRADDNAPPPDEWPHKIPASSLKK